MLLTSDEEGAAVDGTVRVVEALQGARRDAWTTASSASRPRSTRSATRIKNGRRGSLSGRLTRRGVQGHVAYPHLARNPVHLLAPALAELATTQWDSGNEYFPPTTWQISNIHAGTGAGNVIPGSVEVDFNFRFSTASTDDGLMQRRRGDPGEARPRLSISLGARRPALPQRRGKLAQTVTDVCKRHTGHSAELSTTGGTSDARFIIEISPEVLELGPVNASIHKLNEHIEVAAIEQLAGIYLDTLRALLALKVSALLRDTARRFTRAGLHYGHGTHNAREEAAWLISSVLGYLLEQELNSRQTPQDRSPRAAPHPRAHPACLPAEGSLARRACLLRRRARIVPRSFIAELLRDHLSPWLPREPKRVLDLCTGSGCLAVLLALEFPNARVDAADLSRAALQVAQINVRQIRAGKARARRPFRSVRFDQQQKYDLIVSNPPYVTARSMRRLPQEYRHEPALALAAG